MKGLVIKQFSVGMIEEAHDFVLLKSNEANKKTGSFSKSRKYPDSERWNVTVHLFITKKKPFRMEFK